MRISVIISNRNDTSMLAITVRSALEELSAVPGGGEVVIVDNSDAEYIEAVESVIPERYKGKQVRILRQDYPCLFTAREQAAREARGEYLFCVDSHVLFGHNVLIDAVNFMNRRRRRKIGFGSIPINWLCQHEGASKHDMKHLHGTWGKHYEEERRISWKGMPWICRRDWFLTILRGYGALSENKLAWGGGDMYLGVKTWRLGYENWSIPARPVMHIGPMPAAARPFHKYRLYSESGQKTVCLGFLVAFYALGANDDYFDRPEIESFLQQRVGQNFRELLPQAAELADRDRKRIEAQAVYSFDRLDTTPPWDPGIEYRPYLEKCRPVFQTAKSIKEEDWHLFQRLVREYDVKGVVEFGCGLSTLLWDALGIRCTSLETDAEYMAGVAGLVNGTTRFFPWDNQRRPANIGPADWSADLALVDGVDPRDRQIDLAMTASRRILVHDGYSRPTRQFVAEKLSDWREIKVDSIRSRFFIKEP